MDSGEDTRFSGLLDAEQRHQADPHSFSIPRSDVRRSLAVGDLVKLLFGFGRGDPPSAERMWVEIVDVSDDGYVGRLENTPQAISDLRPGDLVPFRPLHVAATYRVVEGAPSADQFAVVSDRVWMGGEHPTRAIRVSLPDERFSGWVLATDDDPPIPPIDTSGFGPVSHREVTDRYRSFDAIEDEPPDSRWHWNEAELEWQPDADGSRPRA